ncbi:ArsR/SmtB family transcription factor [Evansella cellulosilytica]|uniref:Regulatory protein ArsR n=1 Tax=Evansella cellulosilytica (strain ATCC 21833 / DSM 2522 / FERM P-1141 / JCM 9156 / N-4) TaxID=649639 RepID=E6TRS7_EVAC2|nr:metalloregulator ArsR/SmtB family transcription factor [Evansella cellulosilytica]ADU29450.1 regulatory protein ArsR [Evansella cellulosilytica DSM 2522]
MSAQKKYDVFQAIADPTRREIVRMLAKRDMPVTLISEQFEISRPAVSKHLKVLSESQVVSVQRFGREKRYHLEREAFLEIKEWLAYFDQFWDNKLEKLRHTLEGDTNHIRPIKKS